MSLSMDTDLKTLLYLSNAAEQDRVDRNKAIEKAKQQQQMAATRR